MRLDRARRCLQQPEPCDSVTSIAQACGYRSINLFTIDFEQRFHVKPSDLLRESRLPPSGTPPPEEPDHEDRINEV
jgi:transcriptional regulator GlxA family with amidase domain